MREKSIFFSFAAVGVLFERMSDNGETKTDKAC